MLYKDLKQLVKKFRKTSNLDVYYDVLASDELAHHTVLRKINQHDISVLIVNLDDSHSSGSHWVAFFIDRDSNKRKRITLFDSYAIPILNKHLQKAVNLISDERGLFRFFNRRIQSSNSEQCGKFCLMYLHFKLLCRFRPNHSFMNLFFKTKLEKNDRVITTLYNEHFRRPHRQQQIGRGNAKQTCRTKSFLKCDGTKFKCVQRSYSEDFLRKN